MLFSRISLTMKSSAAPDATNSATSGEYLVSHCKSSVIHVSLGCRSARQPECNIGPTANSALLDSYPASDQQIEALGVTDWTISRRIVALVQAPVILAEALGSARGGDRRSGRVCSLQTGHDPYRSFVDMVGQILGRV